MILVVFTGNQAVNIVLAFVCLLRAIEVGVSLPRDPRVINPALMLLKLKLFTYSKTVMTLPAVLKRTKWR